MLDVNFIRENRALVEKSAKEKGYTDVDIAKILKLDDERKSLLQNIEKLRKERNEIAAKMKGGKPSEELIKRGKAVKEQLAKFDLGFIEGALNKELKAVPNIIFDDVPLGGEECSKEIKKWGAPKEKGVDHLDYAVKRGWLDFERGAKVAGAKFYYLKGGLALLENALFQYGLNIVLKHGFTPMDVPDMVSSRVLEGAGFAPNPQTNQMNIT